MLATTKRAVDFFQGPHVFVYLQVRMVTSLWTVAQYPLEWVCLGGSVSYIESSPTRQPVPPHIWSVEMSSSTIADSTDGKAARQQPDLFTPT